MTWPRMPESVEFPQLLGSGCRASPVPNGKFGPAFCRALRSSPPTGARSRRGIPAAWGVSAGYGSGLTHWNCPVFVSNKFAPGGVAKLELGALKCIIGVDEWN